MRYIQDIRRVMIAGALVTIGGLGSTLPGVVRAACPVAKAGCSTTQARVIVDGVGLIPAKSDHYSTVLHLKQYGAFVELYHTTYRGTLMAHVSVDRNSHTIYRAPMSSTTKGRTFFYVWTQFRSQKQLGHLVAYLTIQAGSTKVTKELPFTLAR